MRTINSRRLIVTAVAVIPLAAVAIARFWSPDILAALILIPAWCWLVPGIASVVVAKWAKRKALAKVLALIWFVYALGAVEETRSLLNLGTGQPDGRIRIVSLNCANTPKCLADIRGVNPDVVLLQEAPGDASLAEMTRELFGESGSFLCGGDAAILARRAIEPKYIERAGHFVAGTVSLPSGQTINCISLRLSPPPPHVDFWSSIFWTSHRDCRVEHRRQLEAVAAVAVRMRQTAPNMPFAIGGDFNTTPGDRALAELRPAFRDAFFSSGAGIGGTGTNDWPLFRVDQVWTNSKIRPIRTGAVKTVWSDHRMVVCDVEIGR